MKNKTNYWKTGFIILAVFIAIAATTFASCSQETTVGTHDINNPKGQVVCTQEAKLCPDGKTYVSRTGPNCEFAPCPSTPSSSTPSKEDEQ